MTSMVTYHAHIVVMIIASLLNLDALGSFCEQVCLIDCLPVCIVLPPILHFVCTVPTHRMQTSKSIRPDNVLVTFYSDTSANPLPCHVTHPLGRIEKHILRAAFDTPENPYLPHEILWRQKEQVSTLPDPLSPPPQSRLPVPTTCPYHLSDFMSTIPVYNPALRPHCALTIPNISSPLHSSSVSTVL